MTEVVSVSSLTMSDRRAGVERAGSRVRCVSERLGALYCGNAAAEHSFAERRKSRAATDARSEAANGGDANMLGTKRAGVGN